MPLPSPSSSQAAEEVPPDICQGFVRSTVAMGHPGKGPGMCCLLGRSCHLVLLYSSNWLEFQPGSFMKKHEGDDGFKTHKHKKETPNGDVSRKLLKKRRFLQGNKQNTLDKSLRTDLSLVLFYACLK